ncbi:MAG: hypothetical protein AB1512_11555 [Thermodesulfobacteriota bacterium]
MTTEAMDGLTRTGGMVEVRLCKPSGPADAFGDFARLLARHRINMNVFIGTLVHGVNIVSCVSNADEDRLKDLTDSCPDLRGEVEWAGPVGLISVFPHRSSLKAVGSAITALARAHIPMHGFCSSLSAVTFIIDQALQEKALSALVECFEIPDAQIYSR